MPLATKNNAIILKDGKLAQDCGCCGGWYCYKQCDSCKSGKIPAYVRTSITYTMGDGSTTFSMRLRRMQTESEVTQGACPSYIGRSNAWPIREDGDPTLGPRITFTNIYKTRITYDINIAVALSFTDLCTAQNAVRIEAGDNIYFGSGWMLTPGASVAVGASLVQGNTFAGASFVSVANGLCYGDYLGSGPIPIETKSGGLQIYRGTLSLSVTGVE